MKKIVYLTLLSCSSLFAVPAWQFTISYEDNRGIVSQESAPILFRPDRKSGSIYLPHSTINGYGITVGCTELGNDEVEYLAEVSCVTKATVTAKIGQDASITLQTAQGGMTITFSSRI